MAVLVAQLAVVGQHLALPLVAAPHANVLRRRRSLADHRPSRTLLVARTPVGRPHAAYILALNVAGMSHSTGIPAPVGHDQFADVGETLAVAGRGTSTDPRTIPSADRRHRASPGRSNGDHRTPGGRRTRLGGATDQDHGQEEGGEACRGNFKELMKFFSFF